MQKYDKLIAVDIQGAPKTQHQKTTEPKVYTVEEVYSDGTFKVYNVGSYDKPLHFDEFGYPLFHFYSRLALEVKLWKPYHLVPYANAN